MYPSQTLPPHRGRWRISPIWILGALLGLVLPPRAHAQSFVAEWTESDIGRIGPTGMAIDHVGSATYLYVADQPLGRIIKIDLATGTRVAAWGQTGNGMVEFNSPYGIAVDPTSHDLYVAERGNDRIQRITNTGQFVMAWGGMGTAPGQLEAPIGVAADAAGNVYVVDHDNNRVQKFHVQQTATGWTTQVVTTWGGPGSGPGQFNAPYGITLDSAGHLWVADGQNHRLQVFDTAGNFIKSVGTFGTGDGQFITPTWVNFDANGNYYVAETNSDPQNTSAPDLANQRIQEFAPDGTFLLKWGTYGESGGQFKLPFDVVVDNQGSAYVSDYYNTRIEKFSLGSTGGGGTVSAQFANVSSRLHTNAGRPLIAGFVVGGTAPKQILVRAVGPTLSQYGVTGFLPNPSVQVYSGSKLVAQNEDWGGDATISAAATKVGAFALPANSTDGAVLLTLSPGAYTAEVGTNGGDGIALVEVYDVDGSTANRVTNLSTRGYVDTGDGVLVAGFVIKGTTPKQVLVRGIGPALANYGVTDAVSDPKLELYRTDASGNTLVAQNDNWSTGQTVAGGPAPASAAQISAAATATGAFALPAGSPDSSLLITLQPGAYSAMVSGVNGGTGTGLVEVYEVPGP
ncbi:MAG TPA: hypothetical protein VHE61_16925 [Opitutaceae bacterium]|nr:hypothetical protein [Opitutaceae bacterium]